MEGANDSLNLHDAAVLERLAQLTSTPDKRPHEVESSINSSYDIAETADLRTSTSKNEKEQSDLSVDIDLNRVKSEKNKGSSVTPDGHEKKTHQRKKKHKNVPENPAEDLVVLSFSSSTGECDFNLWIPILNKIIFQDWRIRWAHIHPSV